MQLPVQLPDEPPLIVPSAHPKRLRVVILVDYDNAVSHAKKEGFFIAFERLTEYARIYGDVIFTEAFLSPYSTQTDTIEELWSVHYTPIPCRRPLWGKDDVDQRIRDRTMSLLSSIDIDRVLLLSADRDFSHLPLQAHTLGKQVVLLDPRKLRKEIEGEKRTPLVLKDPATVRFGWAIDQLSGEEELGGDPTEERVQFIADVIRAIAKREHRDSRRIGFKDLTALVWNEIRKGHPQFAIRDVEQALTTLGDHEILNKSVVLRMNYYTLNKTHPAVKKVLQQKKRPNGIAH